MYRLIETHHNLVIASVTQDHVQEYDWLVDHLRKINVTANTQYQKRYCKSWGLSDLYVDSDWLKAYFNALERAKRSTPAVGNLCKALFQVPSKGRGGNKLQYSFCSQIVHMVMPGEPIFDSRIEDFYVFRRPGPQMSLANRIARFDQFLQFLRGEYARVIGHGLLTKSIAAFKTRFPRSGFTAEKIIDSLIWAWIKVCKNGAITSGRIRYQ